MKQINWFFLVAGTFVMIYVMSVTGKSLKTPATPLGILNLELAYNSSKINTVLIAWSGSGENETNRISAAKKNTWLDFIFIFFYALFLFYSCITISDSFTGLTRSLGRFFAAGALNAGLLDIAENAGMLMTLNGFSSNSIALLTAICSAIKWSLALAALFYVLFLGPLYLLRKMNNRNHP